MKVAICGAWHVHAGGYTATAKKLGEVIGVYDRDPARKAKFAEQNEIPAFSDFDALLASDAEGVIVCSATDDHEEDMLRLAGAGKHIFTEKVLSLSVGSCRRIASAVEAAGVRFVISLPKKYSSEAQTVRRELSGGDLGKINYIRYRNCHGGSSRNWLPTHFYNAKECGGGAMIDLGAHGMYLIDWLLGLPTEYRSLFSLSCPNPKNTDGVEDNAVTVMGYSDGCIAVNETGFVSGVAERSLEVHGETGDLCWSASQPRLLRRTLGHPEWEAVPLSPALPSPIEQFMTGEILPGCGIGEALRLTEMMVGAYRTKN